MKVAQIATFVGIPNTSYFNRIFKSEFGVTPSDYRKGVRKND
jgi:AraC-like DNA-binding protein